MQPLSDNLTNVPAFLTKLWKMVSDSKTDSLIRWSQSENSFIILNQVQFWYELLPLYYKHNNMSSFVRQLNMYGFHKVSSVENGSVTDGEKDEVQFYHPYFQKGRPELLKLIKRKVTVSKNTENNTQVLKNEDLSKVLSDVKQLRGRQASVDNQLAAMKQENAVLWRELAVLRQKHTKQQQIVNKLIQFLVSMVHPVNGRMGVGVKRHYPLMLGATPSKKSRTAKNNTNKPRKVDGPTIHELDNEFEGENEIVPDELLEATPEIYSPLTPTSSTPSIGVLSPLSNIDLPNDLINDAENTSAENQGSAAENFSANDNWKKTPYVLVEESDGEIPLSNELSVGDVLPEVPMFDILEDSILNEEVPEPSDKKVFMNSESQNALLSNLINGGYNTTSLKSKNTLPAKNKKITTVKKEDDSNPANTERTVAKRTPESGKMSNSTNDCFSGDLGFIIDNNQSELDLYKDLLQGSGTWDSNTLLGLFNDGALEYGLSFSQDEQPQGSGDPMVSGQEVAILPLEELLDDSLNSADIGDEILKLDLSQLNTPQISDIEPDFPVDKS